MWRCTRGAAAWLLGICLFAAVFSIGCDDSQRHAWLTLFFEGVPPVDKDARPSSSVVVLNTGGLPADGTAGDLSAGSLQRRGSRHSPARDCTICHASSFRQYERELIEPVPQLCYSCHDRHETPTNRLHGPVAVGECVFCHNPHQSGYVHLQVAPQPDLCYRCHVRGDIAAVAGHDKMEEMLCTDCHDPHASEHEDLLKIAATLPADPNIIELID
ncbi:MAG: hypothetical protein IH624_01055 [Phycisphaerae bacterium]|nr:hypothetical protein [Phycisphaerae bacterium]